MAGDTTDWTELREFRSVDLARSFVVSWGIEAESLNIDVDLFLCPDHPFYEKPRPAEGACFRAALLEFPYCSRAAPAGSARDRDPRETIARLRTGRIDGLTRTGEGVYEITGDFGAVEIHAERPVLRLQDRGG